MMKDIRPDFKDIKSFEEFNRYYWYREELSQICKSLGLEYRCTKQELNLIIEQFFKGNRVEKSVRKVNKNQTESINLNTPLLECGFSFNQKFRDYFSHSLYYPILTSFIYGTPLSYPHIFLKVPLNKLFHSLSL